MSYRPFRAQVVRTQRLSPNFMRITLGGEELTTMGPAGPPLDVRVKLIFPGPAGLPSLDPSGNWYEEFSRLDPTQRGSIRTYSIRALRPDPKDTAAPGHKLGTEVDIDFVLHGDGPHAGPAASWAKRASAGDEVVLIAPQFNDASGAGIEFAPGGAGNAHLYGDETAVPAMCSIVADWPAGLTGSVDLEVPLEKDIQEVIAPPGVTVRWHPRGACEHGALLHAALATRHGLLSDAPPAPAPTESANSDELIWETPGFSAAGEDISPPSQSSLDSRYFWVAGESTMVTTLRRYLVKDLKIPRSQVSFMGYWKRGVAMS